MHIADVSELRPCTNVSIETAAMLVTSRQNPSVPKASHVMRNMIAGMCRRIMWSKSLASRSRTHSHYDPMTCAQFPRALALKPLVMRRLGLLRLAKQSDVNRSETLKSSNSFFDTLDFAPYFRGFPLLFVCAPTFRLHYAAAEDPTESCPCMNDAGRGRGPDVM